MKIIEKKCPNCGAGLSFNDSDNSCKCDYCHREFEIERDEKKEDDDIYTLIDPETAKTVAKTGVAIFAASSIIPIFAVIAFIAIFAMVGFGLYKDANSDYNPIDKPIPAPTGNVTKAKTAVKDISELSNTQLKVLSDKTSEFLDVKGEQSTNYSYHNEDEEVVKNIVAYKDEANYVFVVKKVLYINFFNQKDKKTVFIPVKYENVSTGINSYSSESQEIFDGAVVDAPRYNLNKKKSCYLRGAYGDYNQFVKERINPLKEMGYTITEK